MGPGAFTNQIQAAFREPRLLLISDPRTDHQPVTEASYANIPIVAFTNVDSPTKFIAIAAPAPAAGFQVTDDWAAQTETTDWAAQSAPAAPGGDTWGGTATW